MACDFYLSAISDTLKGIREELARANRLKRYELEQTYAYDSKIQKAFNGGGLGVGVESLKSIYLDGEEDE